MQTASKKVINGWAMYDWANSVYNLVITTTFFPIYFTKATQSAEHGNNVSFFGKFFVNSALYDYAMAAAFILAALLSPILSSIADTRGNKKRYLMLFTWLGGLSCCALFNFKGPEPNVEYGVIFFILATLGYCGGLVFYNSYLPEIAAVEDRDRISAKGFAMGYIGSVILQLIGFVLVVFLPLGIDDGQAVRITFLLVGLWWIGFSQITFLRLPASRGSVTQHSASALTEGFREIKKVYAQVKALPVLKRFLRGFFFYSMGVQTVMMAATIFGSQELGLPSDKLIASVVAIQLVAVLGAWAMAKLSGKYGNLPVLMIVIILWIAICLAGYRMQTDMHFYMLAVAVGLVMGGVQSLSRSTYAKLMPDTEDTASFFSYYDVLEKLSVAFGLITFGYIHELTGSMRNSVLALVLFFVIGLIWLYSAQKIQKSATVKS
ncbi:MFS transporter [Chitinophaga rhizophila]|uniref:MFS transporter n=1 Tax=Chitinophaga rhizophila TaxID=2866212 RepID=A0ABS7GHK7_9BACT|nr:MFS transporter [Chitinophaga rhizophila]MBW8686615.1 MFS transporter [Chitinophaga rhizophila]